MVEPGKIHDLCTLKIKDFLPARPNNAHKGDFGHVLVIGGTEGMAGAVRIAAEGAARIGAGLVSIATHPAHANNLAAVRPEIMSHGVEKAADLLPLINRATMLVIGPGLGQNEWSRTIFSAVITSSLPRLVDADALNLLAVEPQQAANWILTPHPGEAARLLQCHQESIQSNRVMAVQQLQERYQGTIVLKGAGSLIAGEKIWRCHAGNPGMATGGMGDLLSGVIAGLVAQGLTLEDAARLGVYLHARSADDAVAVYGERGLLATDLLPFLRKWVNAE